ARILIRLRHSSLVTARHQTQISRATCTLRNRAMSTCTSLRSWKRSKSSRITFGATLASTTTHPPLKQCLPPRQPCTQHRAPGSRCGILPCGLRAAKCC
ncbi:hypothetical protein BGZ98_004054, partial [Dissophora globulifera]